MMERNIRQNRNYYRRLCSHSLRILISHVIVILGYTLIITLPPNTQGETQIKSSERETTISNSNASLLCPKALSNIPNVCDRFKCFRNITKDDCPLDTFFIKNLTLCGCCPGCAKFLGPLKASRKN